MERQAGVHHSDAPGQPLPHGVRCRLSLARRSRGGQRGPGLRVHRRELAIEERAQSGHHPDGEVASLLEGRRAGEVVFPSVHAVLLPGAQDATPPHRAPPGGRSLVG